MSKDTESLFASTRPEPWGGGETPPGFHFEAVDQATDGFLEWIIPPVGAGRCRFTVGPGRKACGAPAVATLMRGADKPRPWDYCADYMYGSWIEDGKVMGWRLVKDKS